MPCLPLFDGLYAGYCYNYTLKTLCVSCGLQEVAVRSTVFKTATVAEEEDDEGLEAIEEELFLQQVRCSV